MCSLSSPKYASLPFQIMRSLDLTNACPRRNTYFYLFSNRTKCIFMMPNQKRRLQNVYARCQEGLSSTLLSTRCVGWLSGTAGTPLFQWQQFAFYSEQFCFGFGSAPPPLQYGCELPCKCDWMKPSRDPKRVFRTWFEICPPHGTYTNNKPWLRETAHTAHRDEKHLPAYVCLRLVIYDLRRWISCERGLLLLLLALSHVLPGSTCRCYAWRIMQINNNYPNGWHGIARIVSLRLKHTTRARQPGGALHISFTLWHHDCTASRNQSPRFQPPWRPSAPT